MRSVTKPILIIHTKQKAFANKNNIIVTGTSHEIIYQDVFFSMPWWPCFCICFFEAGSKIAMWPPNNQLRDPEINFWALQSDVSSILIRQHLD